MKDKLEELRFNVAWALEYAHRAVRSAKMADEIIDELISSATEQANALVHRGQGIEFRSKAAANCFDELARYAFKYDEPDKETALQIIERYLAAFAASSLPPNGK